MPTNNQKRALGGRFARDYSEQDLLALVRRIAEQSEVDDPESISQAAYDRTRRKLSGPRGPRAYRIVRRLNTPWPKIVAMAFGAAHREKTIGARGKKQARDELDRETIVHYLQLVARHLKTEQLTVGDYDQGREELIESDQRRTIHGGELARLIPRAQLIVTKAGSWRKALDWAGLQPVTKRKIPEYPAGQVLDDFIADFGFLPSRRALELYRQARGVAVTGFPSRSKYVAWRDREMSQGRARRHGVVPLRVLGGPIELDPAKISPAPTGYARAREKDYGIDRAKEDLGKAIDLHHGRSLSQRDYQHLATTHGLLAMGTIQRIGKRNGGLTWGQIRDQVVAERAKRS